MSRHSIAILPGDGIGPEVVDAAIIVLTAVEKTWGIGFDYRYGKIGGAAIDAAGSPLPSETLSIVSSSDAVLLGSIGGPKWDHLSPEMKPEIGGLLKLRQELALFANLRPVRVFDSLKGISPLCSRIADKTVDLITVRELSGGIYFGQPKQLSELIGLDTMLYHREEVRRIAEVAFKIASVRRGQVVSIDKANVLHSSMLWRRVVTEFSDAYEGIELSHMYVDNAAMQLVLDPTRFDVILTGNMFGDIISDESAAIAGSLGMLPSVSLGDRIHLFEPAGGSAPDIAGRGIANPVAQILSAALMLEYSFDYPEICAAIYRAVDETMEAGIRTADIVDGNMQSEAVSTSEMAAEIATRLRR